MSSTKDNYNTFKTISQGLFKDRGSKFLAFGYPVTSELQIKEIITAVRKKYHDARHHCYAYKLGASESNYRVNDDGEPSGTAGRPMLGQIIAHNLSDVLIIVVRYFGGTLLGTNGLINAYRSAAADCITKSEIVTTVLKDSLHIRYKYELLSSVMRIVKDENLEITHQDFTVDCKLELLIRQSEYERILKRFQDIYGIVIS